MKDRLQIYIKHLRELSKGIEKDCPHYFEVEGECVLEGIPSYEDEYCETCANKIFDKFVENGGDKELVRLRSQESSSSIPANCEDCGLPLWSDYSDTDIRQELEHYEMYGDKDTLDPQYKYEPVVLLDLAEACDDEDCKYLPRLLEVFKRIMPTLEQE